MRQDQSVIYHSFDNVAKNNVFTIKPLSFYKSDEKLAAVCVRSGIGHGHPARTVMSNLKVLILKAGSINATTTSTISIGKITTLDHEVINDTVEDATLVAQLLAINLKK